MQATVLRRISYASEIDYFACNKVKVVSFDVIDPDINFSDHSPLLRWDRASTTIILRLSYNLNYLS